jgi:hypothetical protein
MSVIQLLRRQRSEGSWLEGSIEEKVSENSHLKKQAKRGEI